MTSNQVFRRLSRYLCGVVILSLSLPWMATNTIQAAPSAEFNVNYAFDTLDVTPGNGVCADNDGHCSLRAAIQETNALPGWDTIILPSFTNQLARPNAGENNAVNGDLDILGDLTILGAGASESMIDADAIDRAFHILPGVTVTITGVTITDGHVPDNTPDGVLGGGGIYNQGSLRLIESTVSWSSSANGTTGSVGNAGDGGGILNVGALVLDHSTIQANITGGGLDGYYHGSGGNGGGVASTAGSLTLLNSTISFNGTGSGGDALPGVPGGTGGLGGGIYIAGGTAQITGSTIQGNIAGAGGAGGSGSRGGIGGGGGGIYNAASLTITNSSINLNESGDGGIGTNYNASGGLAPGGSGGGLFTSAPIILQDVTISGNSAGDGGATSGRGAWGGGLHCVEATVVATNLTLTNNHAGNGSNGGATGGYGGNGGGLFAYNCTTTITGGTVSGNSSGNGGDGTSNGTYAGNGGGLGFENGTATLNSLAIQGNWTGNGGGGPTGGNAGNGGGLYNSGATVYVNDSTLSGNWTGNAGTGDNGWSGSGGGAALSGTNYLTNVTVSGNTIGSGPRLGRGGGLVSNGNVYLRSVTVAYNSTGGFSGGISTNMGSIYARNSLIANNSADTAPDCNFFYSQEYNLVGDMSGCEVDNGETNLLGIAPQIGALANNGGPTQTHALQLNSPAIDAAQPAEPGSGGNACPVTDQRGQLRSDLRCDIGAYEATFSGGTVVVTRALAPEITVSFGPGLAAMTLNTGNAITGTVQRSDIAPTGFPPDRAVLGVTTVITVTEGTGSGMLAPLAFDLDLSLCYTSDEASGLNSSLLQMYRWEASAWIPLGGVSNVAQRCVKRTGVTLGGKYALAVPPEQIFLPVTLR